MAHTFEFKVTVTVERMSGKFASRDEIADALRDEIGEPYRVYGVGADGMSEYEVVDFQVEDDDSEERIKKLRDRIRHLESEIKLLSARATARR